MIYDTESIMLKSIIFILTNNTHAFTELRGCYVFPDYLVHLQCIVLNKAKAEAGQQKYSLASALICPSVHVFFSAVARLSKSPAGPRCWNH